MVICVLLTLKLIADKRKPKFYKFPRDKNLKQ